ncbi:MAG: F0F1 ATP synthase subunit B, partial [Sinobacteraceae bacterium]|nr:F0F1 ATP synthase subunit B [Nevskiaceae bacterium]
LSAMEERQRKIAQGLAAAEEGEKELSQARDKADAIIREARERANQIIDHAQHRANELIDQAKGAASSESARIVAAAQQQIELDTTRAKESLRREVAGIAVGAASKLLGREIDARAHADLLEQLAEEI